MYAARWFAYEVLLVVDSDSRFLRPTHLGALLSNHSYALGLACRPKPAPAHGGRCAWRCVRKNAGALGGGIAAGLGWFLHTRRDVDMGWTERST